MAGSTRGLILDRLSVAEPAQNQERFRCLLVLIDQRREPSVAHTRQHCLSQEPKTSLQGVQAQPQGAVSNLDAGFGLRAGQLHTKMTIDQMEEMLTRQEKRWWSVKIQSFEDKWHFLQYAGRYLRRPPIAQRRITWIGERTVRFWFKDKRLRRKVEVQCSLEEFVDRWAQHIPEGYKHAVRSFGLVAPRALRQTSAAIFVILRQERRPRPKPRSWADSLKQDFGRDPLLDHTGKRMKWPRRLAPKPAR